MLTPDLITPISTIPYRQVTVGERQYPLATSGIGKIPLVAVGIGSHIQMTFSPQLRRRFTIHSSDLYWISSHRIQAPHLTLEQIVADACTTVEMSGAEKPIVAGFSCFGLLALEVAKRMGGNIRGVMMISTPPGWNDAIIAFAQNHFASHASVERQENDRNRRAHFAKIRRPGESLVSINAYEADAARYWKDYSVDREFLEALWAGITVDDDIINHFFGSILPTYNVATNLNSIIVPTALFAGQYDYDSTPLLLWQKSPQPCQFTMVDCGESGHWPNLENRDVFDPAVEHWAQSL